MSKQASEKTTSQASAEGTGAADQGAETPTVTRTQLEQSAAAVAQRNDQAMQTFVNWLTEAAETTDEDQYDAMAAIMGEILASDNIEEMLKESTVLSAPDVVGKTLLLHSYAIREGDYEDSLVGFYAALTVSTLGSDKTRIVTCGGMKVLAKIYKLAQFGEFPQLIKFTAKTTSKGNPVYDIVRPKTA